MFKLPVLMLSLMSRAGFTPTKKTGGRPLSKMSDWLKRQRSTPVPLPGGRAPYLNDQYRQRATRRFERALRRMRRLNLGPESLPTHVRANAR